MTSADVFAQIEKMGELPSLPQSLLNIQTVATDDSSSAEDLARCILKDQALTMRILKVVNSAMYQRRNQENVKTVRRAVIVMGFETVRKLALGLSVFDMMSKLSRSPWLAEISKHSLICGVFAQILAEASGKVVPEEAFVTALIHDIGKVVLLECSPEAMDQVLADMAGGSEALEAERRYFGLTHDRAGRRLAGRWRLPTDLQNIIGDHHDIDPLHPPKSLEPRLGVIVYANAMSRFSCTEKTRENEYRILLQAGQALGISLSRLEEIYSWIADEISDIADRVGVDMGDLADYGMIVNVEGSVNVAPRRLTPEEIAKRTACQLQLYQAVGLGLAAGGDLQPLVDLIMEGAVRILGFERVVFLEIDKASQLLRPRIWAGISAEELAAQLELPLQRETGALALAAIENRSFHVPRAGSEAYGDLVGEALLAAAQCTGFAVATVSTPGGLIGVLYADGGPGGADVVAEQSTELNSLATQLGLVLHACQPQTAG